MHDIINTTCNINMHDVKILGTNYYYYYYYYYYY